MVNGAGYMGENGYNRNIPIEKKLELVQKIRKEHQMNQSAVRGREAYLYGRYPVSEKNSYSAFYTEEDSRLEEAANRSVSFSALKIRLAAAVLLFAVFYSASSQDKSFFGMDAAQIYETVEMDYSANLFDFMDKIPYTLHE